MRESEEIGGFEVVPRREKSWTRTLVRLCVFLGVTGVVAGGALGAALYVYYAPTVPEFGSIEDYQPKVGTRIYSADNQLIGEFAAERRVLVPFDKIPPRLFQAFTSAEDKRFYGHGGLDFIGIAQAIVDKVRKPGSKLRGASTITQQVAKSLLATFESYEVATERSLERKIREAILARRLEERLTKDEILYMYVNQIFLGHKAYGVQAAAEHYFRKNVWELSLAEMATLAGLPQRPSDYSPYSRPKAAKARRRYVLRRMMEEEFITGEEAAAAAEDDLVVYPRRELYLEMAPYFTEQVRRIVVDRFGEKALLEDGLEVHTTLNVAYQKYAQEALHEGLQNLDKRQGYRGPLAQLPKEEDQAQFTSAYRKYLEVDPGQKVTLEKGGLYLAIVTGFTKHGRHVKLDIAGARVFLPLAGMRWARKPNPTERWDYHYIEDARAAFEPGDLIAVKKTTRSALARDDHGWEVADTIPKKGHVFELAQEPTANGALMSVDPRTGYVVAQVGGYHFEDSTFNRAVQACREPGSAFKPVVYSAAIDKLDYTPSTLIDDKPFVATDENLRWKPNNAGERFRGKLPMRTCLQDSINTPAIRIAQAVGIRSIIRNARRLGIKSDLKRELGTALGSSCMTLAELMNVYVTLNRGGKRKNIIFVRRVVDRYGNVLTDTSNPQDPMSEFATKLDASYLDLVRPTRRALDPATAFVMTSLLQNVVRSGTATRANSIGFPVAGKTGTTNDSYDAWFMGFSKDLVTGVWIGHDKKERPLGAGEYGGQTALPIWIAYSSRAMTDYSVHPAKQKQQGSFVPPADVVEVVIDPETGLLARPDSPRAVSEFYRSGTEPTEYTPDKVFLDPTELDLFGADTPL